MKKLPILLLILLVLLPFGQVAYASESEDKLGEEINGQLGALDSSEFDKFLNEIGDPYGQGGLKNYIDKIVSGESAFDLIMLINLLCDGLLDELLSSVPLCASIILICVLSSSLTRFSSKFAQNSTHRIIGLVCTATVLVLMVTKTLNYSNEVLNTLKSIQNFSNIIFPILVTLLTVIGGGGTAGVFSPYIAILSSLLLNGIEAIIFPIFFACLALSVVGNLTDTIRLDKLRGFFSSLGKWILGLGFGLFTTILSGQAMVTSVIDGVSVKATKFALSSYVPILGGYLSEGFDFVMAGSVLIKNAVGLTGIMILAVIILIPLIKLVVFTLALKLTSGVVETLGDSNTAKMISGVSSSVNILTSILLGIGFVFFFVLLLIVFTVNLGVV